MEQAISASESTVQASANYIYAIPALVLLVLFLALHLQGKRKYAPLIQAMDKEEYGLRDIMTVGFMLMEKIRYQYAGKLDRKLRTQLRELYEPEYVEFYLRVQWAAAVTYACLALLLGLLFFAGLGGDFTVLAFFLVLSPVLAYVSFNSLDKKITERHQQVAMDLPDLTNQLIILSGAGLTLRAAIIKVGREMPGESPLYQALRKMVNKMENGTTDETAMDVLTTQCNMPVVRRLCSVLLQNMHRGGTDVLIALREIGTELWTNRKAAARQMAEEVSTKMLFPMMLMLLAVILLVSAPAVMSMKI